jgi:hypothetical protein
LRIRATGTQSDDGARRHDAAADREGATQKKQQWAERGDVKSKSLAQRKVGGGVCAKHPKAHPTQVPDATDKVDKRHAAMTPSGIHIRARARDRRLK